MKLYATTTSDRKDAKSGHNISRGLGANKYIEIILTDETKRKLVKLDVWIDKQNHTILKYEDCMGNQLYHDITLEKAEQKGKKQTTEDLEIEVSKVFFERGKQKKGWQAYQEICKHIWFTPYVNETLQRCSLCGLEQKGKQKKGECGAIDCKNLAEHTYKGISYCDGHYTQIHATE